mmetsp:Transcript_28426/g.60204  ORF Transcript_28426/g.60204 Transcript_28426/m.60204 type:complete len:279 (-) Transcript_28426:677-1513(-)
MHDQNGPHHGVIYQAPDDGHSHPQARVGVYHVQSHPKPFADPTPAQHLFDRVRPHDERLHNEQPGHEREICQRRLPEPLERRQLVECGTVLLGRVQQHMKVRHEEDDHQQVEQSAVVLALGPLRREVAGARLAVHGLRGGVGYLVRPCGILRRGLGPEAPPQPVQVHARRGQSGRGRLEHQLGQRPPFRAGPPLILRLLVPPPFPPSQGELLGVAVGAGLGDEVDPQDLFGVALGGETQQRHDVVLLLRVVHSSSCGALVDRKHVKVRSHLVMLRLRQ